MSGLALLFLAGWAPARAAAAEASVCGSVELLGRPLPSGYVTVRPSTRPWAGPDARGGESPHPGPTERSLVRLRDGRFCVGALEPGNYDLRVSPPGKAAPFLPLAYRGLPGRAEDYRFSAEPAGRWSVHDASGARVLAEREVALAYAPGPAQAGWSRLEGVVSPAAKAGKASREPALVFAHVEDRSRPFENQAPESAPGTYHFAWLEPAAGPSREFSLPVAPGRLLTFWVHQGDLTGSGIRFRLTHPDLSSRARLEVPLQPSGRIQGRAMLPDARPFAPYAGRDASQRRLFSIRLQSLWEEDNSATIDLADADGRFEVAHVPPGFHRVLAQGEGEGFRWSLDAPKAVWVEAGKTVTLDAALGERAEVAVDPQGVYPPPLPGPPVADFIQFWMSRPKERWIVGIPAGPLDPERVATLLYSDEASFSFIQDPRGRWPPRFKDRDEPLPGFVARPGVYDVYLLETTDKFLLPSLRVLAFRPGFRVEGGTPTVVGFPAAAYRPGGSAALRGVLKASRSPGTRELRGVPSLAELLARVAPRVSVTDDQGRLAGAAFTTVTFEDLGELVEAVEKKEAKRAAEFFARRPGEFRLGGLAAGRYRVEAAAYGYVPRTLEVELSEGESQRLDIDLDRR